MLVGIETFGNEVFVLLRELLEFNHGVLELLGDATETWEILARLKRLQLKDGRWLRVARHRAQYQVHEQTNLVATQLAVANLKTRRRRLQCRQHGHGTRRRQRTHTTRLEYHLANRPERPNENRFFVKLAQYWLTTWRFTTKCLFYFNISFLSKVLFLNYNKPSLFVVVVVVGFGKNGLLSTAFVMQM